MGAETTMRGSARSRWLFPTLARYSRRSFGRDVAAGISASVVVIPQAMAYSTIANLPVQVGLYTCIVPLLAYAALGGSRAMSVSTTSTIATLTATTLVTAGVATASDDIPRDLVTLTLMVGLILLVARIFRLGALVEIINRPTLVGIQIGVGSTVAIGQVPSLLGEEAQPTGSGFIRSAFRIVEALPQANPATVLLSVCSIVSLLVLKRFAPRVPAPLLVVVAGIGLSAMGYLPAAGVKLIDPVPQGMPVPTLPTFENIAALIPGAFAIAVMAFLESNAVARAIREPSEPPIKSNQELLATSVANVVGSFTQILPAAGGFSQSAVNKGAGARSQVAGLMTVVLAAFVGLFLGPVLSLLPRATLAALVFVAVLGLLDVKALLRFRRIRRSDFVLALVVMLVGLTAGLITAVTVGVVVTFIMVLRALNRPRIRATPSENRECLHVKLLAPLYTANVLATEEAVLQEIAGHPETRVLELDMARIEETSTTVLDALEDLDRELAGRGVELRIVELPIATDRTASGSQWYRDLKRAGRARPGSKEVSEH